MGTLFIAAFVALLAGFLGGVGGRAIYLRIALGEVWDAIESIQRRQSRREGEVGAKRKRENVVEADAIGPRALLSALGNMRKAVDGGGAADEAEMTRRAHEHFAKKEEEAA